MCGLVWEYACNVYVVKGVCVGRGGGGGSCNLHTRTLAFCVLASP